MASAAGSVIKHRIQEALKGNRKFSPVPRGNSKGRRVAAAGAVATDCNSGRVNTKQPGVLV